jgi:hypothetical protein
METFSIVVKGHRFEASAACSARGIAHVFKAECHNGRETVLLVDSDRDTLARWLGSDVETTVGLGFPIGSLLWYRPWPENISSESL